MTMQHSPLVHAARRSGVRDTRVLRAVAEIPRASFVPDGVREEAMVDMPLPIACGQTTSQPSLVAMMVEALELDRSAKVLEIGTGLGYQAALLSRLASLVWTMEWFVDLASAARENLAREGCANVEVVLGDGSVGLPDNAPYDAIIAGCAAPEVPQEWVDQLAEGGRLVVPVGPGGEEEVLVHVKHDGALDKGSLLTPARFVPLLSGSQA